MRSARGRDGVRLDGAVVLVTGGSRGIGAATAELLAGRGARVVITGRDGAALADVARRCGAAPMVTDLRAPAAAGELVARVVERFGRLDAVVANAGVGHAGPVADMTADRLAEVVDVNLRAPLLLARAATGTFRELALAGDRRARGLVFLTSIAGEVGVPGESVYSAAKGAVEQFAVLLREELRTDAALGDTVVATVVPGVVDTEFFARRGLPYDRRRPRPVAPERVARAVVVALERGTPRTVVPRWLALPARLSAAAPRLYRALARRLS